MTPYSPLELAAHAYLSHTDACPTCDAAWSGVGVTDDPYDRPRAVQQSGCTTGRDLVSAFFELMGPDPAASD